MKAHHIAEQPQSLEARLWSRTSRRVIAVSKIDSSAMSNESPRSSRFRSLLASSKVTTATFMYDEKLPSQSRGGQLVVIQALIL